MAHLVVGDDELGALQTPSADCSLLCTWEWKCSWNKSQTDRTMTLTQQWRSSCGLTLFELFGAVL